MESNLVYAKTPIGDEAVRQSTRVVQRNLRMVLVQVDGNISVAELMAKIGNPRLVESALRELEEGGFIVPAANAPAVWEESRRGNVPPAQGSVPPMSRFSGFGQSTPRAVAKAEESATSNFSSFGKPILPSSLHGNGKMPQPVAEDDVPDEPPARSGMSVGRKVLLASFSLFAIGGAALVFYPYDQFKPALEAAATRWLETPVAIEHVGVTIFPRPSLKLSGVHIGGLADGKITEVRIASPLSLLGSAPRHVVRMDVSGASLSASHLVALPMFMGGAAASRDLLIQKMLIDHLQLNLGDSLAVNDLSGEVVFRPDGIMEKATVETADRSVLVNAQPSNPGLALVIEGRAWAPAGTAVSFASLQARGSLQKNKLLIQNIDTTFLGGMLRGNWLLDWSNGLAMAGEGNVSGLDSRKVSAAFAPSVKLDGEMSGVFRLRGSGHDWDGLWRSLEATLSLEVVRGIFHGVDLGEAVRRGGGAEVQAGGTRFDRLRSTLTLGPTQLLGQDVRMDAGMVTAHGQFTAGRQGQVDGTMSVTMQTSVSTQNAPVHIYGVLPDLKAATRQ